jgi:hypothetical protein
MGGKFIRVLPAAIGALITICMLHSHARADVWAPIDCAQSRLPLPSTLKGQCNRGPDLSGAGEASKCLDEQFGFHGTDQDFIVQLSIVKTNSCYIIPQNDVEEYLKSKFVWVKNNAKNWSDIKDIAGAQGMYFDITIRTRPEKCFAFYRAGPPDLAGIVYRLDGFYCGPEGETLDDSGVVSFLSSLVVNQ